MVSVESGALSNSDEAVANAENCNSDGHESDGKNNVKAETDVAKGENGVAAVDGKTYENGDEVVAGRPATEVEEKSKTEKSPVKPVAVVATSTASVDTSNDVEQLAKKPLPPTSGRGVTIAMLLKDSILKPGHGVLTLEHEGRKCRANLWKDGKVEDEETESVHPSVNAWAISTYRRLNPEYKPSPGMSWCSQIQYKGKELDYFKTLWFINKKAVKEDSEESLGCVKKQVVRHETLGLRYGTEVDRNLLVKCYPFSRIGKLQPFNVSLSVGAFFMIDLHSSITANEVTGYLGGTWDVNSHTLSIKAAYPCRCSLSDTENAPMVEYEIAMAMERANHSLVGWYHSHPRCSPYPSIPDIDAQLEYQIKMKGSSDATYIPCVGIITTPFSEEMSTLETMFSCYWVVPPPESRPMEYPCPMLMEYSASPDPPLSEKDFEETKLLLDFYRASSECIDMTTTFRDGQTYWEKLEASLKPKLMQDPETGGKIWELLQSVFLTSKDVDMQDVASSPPQDAPPPSDSDRDATAEAVPQVPVQSPKASSSAEEPMETQTESDPSAPVGDAGPSPKDDGSVFSVPVTDGPGLDR